MTQGIPNPGKSSESWLHYIEKPLSKERREAAVHCIETVMLSVIRQLANNEDPEILVPKLSQWYSGESEADPCCRVRLGLAASQRRFAIIVMLLSRVHRLLSTGANGTRRQLYYEQVHWLRSQRDVDDNCLCVSRLLHLPPWQLGILPTAKGLVSGQLAFTTIQGETVDCSSRPGGVIIPSDVCSISSFKSNARFILILEKDTIFQRALSEGVVDRLGPCIVVTGKGYPDMSTRVLLARLEAALRVPLLGLGDADPHGVRIMCVYRFGTKALPLPLRSLRWVGLLPSELAPLGVRAVPLTAQDEALACSLLGKPYIADLPGLQTEIKTMLSLGKKAELDALNQLSPCYLTDCYLPNKITSQVELETLPSDETLSK